ncbi:hypothetical protein K469DRAFT_596521, partial [Zopfia rhizophila CBS 207.26]
AGLILADWGLEITSDGFQTLLNAARIKDVEPILTTLFAKAPKDRNISDLMVEVTASAPTKDGDGVTVEGEKNEMENHEGEHGSDEGVADGDESEEDIGLSLFD